MGYTASLARLIWVFAGASMLGGFLSAVYQLSKRFLLTSLVWMLPASGMMFGTVMLSGPLGIKGLVLGMLASGIAAVIVLFLGNTKGSFMSSGMTFGSVLSSARVFRPILPVTISLLPFTMLQAIDAYWATRLPEGSMSYLGYSSRLTLALGNLVLNGIYIVIMPYMAEDAAGTDDGIFMSRLSGAINGVLFFFIPLVAFIILHRVSIISLLFKRGAFSEASVEGVSTVLPFYMLGLLAMGPTTVISRAYFAKNASKRFGLMALFFVALYAVLSGVLSEHLSYQGIGVSYLVFWVLLFVASAFSLHRRLLDSNTMRTILGSLFTSFVSVVAGSLPGHVISGLNPAQALLISMVSSFFIFCAMSYLLRHGTFMAVLTHISNMRRTLPGQIS
jgi:putative peptidoglycan lipid II flippase